MGEISDALRRAKKEGAERRPPPEDEAASTRRRSRSGDSFPLPLDVVQADVERQSAPVVRVPQRAPADRSGLGPLLESVLPDEALGLEEEALGAEAPKHAEVEIPREKEGEWRARSVVVDDAHTAEQYRHFAIRLAREMGRRQLQSIALVSALRSEGKTTTACNLALASASIAGGRRTALLDLDLRRPSIARYMGFRPDVGIDTVLSGHAKLADARYTTELPALDIYPVAHAMNNPHECLAHPRFEDSLRALEMDYDLVICDTPPVLIVPDVALVAPHVGACLPVLRSRQTMRQAFTRMLEVLPREKLLGVFLNDVRGSKLRKYQKSYYRDEDREAPKTEAKNRE